MEVIQTVETGEQKQTESDEPAIIHLSKDDIEEYEESQAKFRELWEKKREKVSNSWIDFYSFIWFRWEVLLKLLLLHKSCF